MSGTSRALRLLILTLAVCLGGRLVGPAASYGADFFPGVKGISGDELDRIIKERQEREKTDEQRRKEAEEARRKKAEERRKRAEERRKRAEQLRKEREERQRREKEAENKESSSTDTPEAETDSGDASLEDVGRELSGHATNDPVAEGAGEAEAEEGDPALEVPDPMKPHLDGIELTEDDVRFLRHIDTVTQKIEFYLPYLREIRMEMEEKADTVRGLDYVLFVLQYRDRRNQRTRFYEGCLYGAMSLYRCVYEKTVQITLFSRHRKPHDFPEAATKAVEIYEPRFRAAWRECLLAMAELYTKARTLPAAERIYAELIREFPEDQEITNSYDVFKRLKSRPEPPEPSSN